MITVLFIINDKKNYKNLKNINYDDLYKKSGYKSNDNFINLYNKTINNITFEFWGKNVGKENLKFSFNNIIYYNKLLIIKKENDIFQNINDNDYNLLINKSNSNNKVKKSISEVSNISNNNNNNNNNNNITNNIDNNISDNDDEISINSELSEEYYIFSSDDEDN